MTKDKIVEAITPGLQNLAKWMEGKKYIGGDNLSWLDFQVFENCERWDWLMDGKFYETYPVFKAYHDSIAAIPALKASCEQAAAMTLNNKIAGLNNTV